MICWDEKNDKIIISIDLSSATEKTDMIYTTCFYENGIVLIPEKNGTCILELHIKENLLVSYDCKEIPGFKIKRQKSQAFAEHIRLGNDGAIFYFPFHANGVLMKTKEGDVVFYKSETVKGLNIAGDQKLQNESTCTLNCFCEKLELQNEKTINGIDIGTKIVLDICKTV